LPEFSEEVATNVLNDLASRAYDLKQRIDMSYGDGKTQLTEELNRVLYGMLEVRAGEVEAGRTRHFLYGDFFDRDNEQIDVDMGTRQDQYEHELEETNVEITTHKTIFWTDLQSLAKARGVNSLDVRKVIGKPDHQIDVDSTPYTQRVVRELLAVKKYKSAYPESSERMSEVMRELAFRLVRMRKGRHEKPLRIGMKRTEDGQGEIIFLWREDPYSILWHGIDDYASVPVSPALQYLIEQRPPKHGIVYWDAIANFIVFRSLDDHEPTEDELAQEEKFRRDFARDMDAKEHGEIPNNWDFWIVSDDQGHQRLLVNPGIKEKRY